MLSACLIARDNADIIGRCLRSFGDHVDEILIIDTGSSDDTKKVAQEAYPDKIKIFNYDEVSNPEGFLVDSPETWSWMTESLPGPFTGKTFLADFAAARQKGLDEAKGNWIFWVDTDDVVVGAENLRRMVEEAQERGSSSVDLEYDYKTGTDGVVELLLVRERLVKKSSAKWVGRIHELLTYVGPKEFRAEARVLHRHGPKKDVNLRNLKVLLDCKRSSEICGDVLDPRTLFYLACEERFLFPDTAISDFERYRKAPSTFGERAIAEVLAANIHLYAGRYNDALRLYTAAQESSPDNPEGFFGEAEIWYYLKNYERCVAKSMAGLDVVRKRPVGAFTLYQDLRRQSFQPHVFLSFSLLSLGRAEEGLASAIEGLKADPSEKDLKTNKLYAEKLIAGNNRKLKIGIWTGPAWEDWSPDSLELGIGGSETAAVCMARELAALGHDVVVYGTSDGTWNGVRYVNYQLASSNPTAPDALDVLVVSRQASAVLYGPAAAVKILWAHDVHCGLDEQSRHGVDAADLIFCLSSWHREFFLATYPGIDQSKVVVTRNGISLDRFASEPIKEGRRVVYSSSPDRGLDRLLDLWPRVRSLVPDAELSVCYGTTTWRKIAESAGDLNSLGRISALEARLASMAALGVKYEGRIGQKKLAELFSASRVWAYPTRFTETSCITAMEAQAAAAIPVASHLAALKETVVHGYLLRQDPESPEYSDLFVRRVVDVLTNVDGQSEEVGRRGREHALANFSWAPVARSWDVIFKTILATKTAAKKTTSIEVSGRLKIAVMLGSMGTSVHGLIDPSNPWGNWAALTTGTVAGFFQISRGLSELGHHVDAFCDATMMIGNIPQLGGANIIPWTNRRPGDQYDAYLSINEPDLLRQFPTTKTRLVAQWLNDWSYCQPDSDRYVDAYACPSSTHSIHLRNTTGVDSSKLVVLPIPIGLELHDRNMNPRGRSVAYTSSPDRGLHNLLTIWPEIRNVCPDATLDVYYRVLPWISDMAAVGSPEMKRRASLILGSFQELGDDGRNGVTLVGPTPPAELARRLSLTSILAYPCDPDRFAEGYSLSILDACAAGCIPLISDTDALDELWSGTAIVVRGKPSEVLGEWTEKLTKLLLAPPELLSESRAVARCRARELSRRPVTKLWEEFIVNQIKKKAA